MEVIRPAHLDRMQCHLESGGCGFAVSELRGLSRVRRVPQHGYLSRGGDSFFQYREPLAAQLRRQEAHAGHVPARSCKIRDEAGTDWIRGDQHDDRNCRRDFSERQNRRLAEAADDYVRLKPYQFRCGPRIALRALHGRPTLEDEILVLDPTVIAEPSCECFPKHPELRVI